MADYPSLYIAYPYMIEPPDYGVLRTEMEQGYVQTRPKVTKSPRKWKFMHKMLTVTEKATWLTFWNAKKAGSDVFSFHDHDTNTDINVRFSMKEASIVWVSPGRFNISVELEEAL